MADTANPDEGVIQEDSGSVTTQDSTTDYIAANQELYAETSKADETPAANLLDDEPAESEAPKDKTTETVEESEDVDQLLKDTEDDKTPIIHKLRTFLKQAQKEKFELSQTLKDTKQTDVQAPSLDAENLLKNLKSFDLQTGQPTSRPFADNLYKDDPQLAQQVYEDLSAVADEQGWTLAHHFMKKNGIDPTRLDDIRAFLRGEVDTANVVGVVPDVVPPEYREAFQSLSTVNQEDIVFNLDSNQESPANKQAALETLRDRQYRLDNTKQDEARIQQMQAAEQEAIFADVDKTATETYTSMFQALEEGAAFTKTVISSDPKLDAVAKASFLTQLNALGSPDTMLGRRATSFMEDSGVVVNHAQIQGLMRELDDAFHTKAIATKKGYSAYANDANAIITGHTAKLVALANKYFVAYARKLNGDQKAAAEEIGRTISSNAAPPTMDGAPSIAESRQQAGSASKQLKDMAASVAAANRQLGN